MRRNELLDRLAWALPYRYRRNNWLMPATVGVGIGVAAGIGLGLLYAPRPGSETRERLRQGAKRAGEKARMTADRVRGQLESSAEELRERAFAASSEVGQTP